MINLKQKAVELESSKWKRFKIKHGFTDIPEYACSTVKDFLDNKDKMKISEEVLFPSLNYLGLNQEEREKLGYEVVPIVLQDLTGEVQVYIRPAMSFGFVADNLHDLWAGGSIYNVRLINGVQWPGESKPDERIYLRSFKFHHKKQKNYSEKFSEILEKIFNPELSAETIKI
jgi:hypothetical protein